MDTIEEKPKKLSYIEKLQQENAKLKAELERANKDIAAVDPGDMDDDRNEIVEINMGKEYAWQILQLPKHEALKRLVSAYINMKIKAIPREDQTAHKINQAVGYFRLKKLGDNGEKLTVYKEAPLWLIAERIIDHPNAQIDLVNKSEWDEYNEELAKQEEQYNKPINKGKIARAIDVLASQ